MLGMQYLALSFVHNRLTAKGQNLYFSITGDNDHFDQVPISAAIGAIAANGNNVRSADLVLCSGVACAAKVGFGCGAAADSLAISAQKQVEGATLQTPLIAH